MRFAGPAYIQHKAGLVDQITLETSHAVLRYMLSQPVYRALWISGRRVYAPEWVQMVDQLIKETPLAQPRDSVVAFQSILAQVLN